MDDERARLLLRVNRYAFPLPDAVMALLLTLAHFVPLPGAEQLAFGLIVEGGFLMAQATLVDIATRLRKRPPLWLAALIVGGVVLFSDHALEVFALAWNRGSVVFLPLLLSLIERGAVLWRLPGRPRIERIAARALAANRITTGLGVLVLITLTIFLPLPLSPFLAGAAYFAIAAFDGWRVRGRRFAEKPRVLFRFDPLHIEYLHPL